MTRLSRSQHRQDQTEENKGIGIEGPKGCRNIACHPHQKDEGEDYDEGPRASEFRYPVCHLFGRRQLLIERVIGVMRNRPALDQTTDDGTLSFAEQIERLSKITASVICQDFVISPALD